MDSQISNTTFFQGAGAGMQWTYTKTSYEDFRHSTRNPPVPDILPDDSFVIGITYFEREHGTNHVTSKIADTQYSITGSMSFGETRPGNSAQRELREELGVDCDNPRIFASPITNMVGRQTYYTFVIPAIDLRPITGTEAQQSGHVGTDDRSRKVQIFVHGSKAEISHLLSSVQFRSKTKTETDIAGVTVIPVKMVTSQYQKSVRQTEPSQSKSREPCRNFNSPRGCSYGDSCRFAHVRDQSRDGYRDGYRGGYRDGYRDGYHDGARGDRHP